MIDWNRRTNLISKYFTVGEATFLPSWNIYLNPNDEEKVNIVATALKMDSIREILDVPIKVHCWIRPEIYNKTIGGSPKSAHITGLAVDFSCALNCDAVRYILLPHLAQLELRMEDLKGASWIHIGNDWREGMRHFFKP
jgi:hypothetical protein